MLTAAGWFSRDVREGLGVGLLGGLTTFSTFSVQAVLDVDAGEPLRAAAYVAVSVVGGIAAAGAGYLVGR
jgi:fluoride exporter